MFAEDHLCSLADQVVRARGERARFFGSGEKDVHLHSDGAMKALRVAGAGKFTGTIRWDPAGAVPEGGIR